MKFEEKDLEIVLKIKQNGDFSVSSNTRENFRVFRALSFVVYQLKRMMNNKAPNLVMPSNHKDIIELTKG